MTTTATRKLIRDHKDTIAREIGLASRHKMMAVDLPPMYLDVFVEVAAYAVEKGLVFDTVIGGQSPSMIYLDHVLAQGRVGDFRFHIPTKVEP